MKKVVISTDQAPAPSGAYTQALAVGPLVFVSGQIPLDPQGRLVEGDIVVQTCQVVANLKAVLAAAGLTLKDVVKTTVFLADMADFQEFNRAYGEFFPHIPGPHHHPGRGSAPGVAVKSTPLAKKNDAEALRWVEDRKNQDYL
jgi:2-iminobutanoate/2-iminopropanoate deaminase